MTSVPPHTPPPFPPEPPTPPTPPSPVVERFVLGPFETTSYLVWVPNPDQGGGGEPARAGAECWIVDPSFEPEALVERARALGVRVRGVVLTHAHVDHIAGVVDVLSAFPGTPVMLHAAEEAWLNDPLLNLSMMMGLPVTAPGPDRVLRDGEELSLGGTRWRVMHTPGHSPGSVTLYHAGSGQALVGDLVMAGSVGRTDFPGSDGQMLVQSIKRRVYTLPDETKLFPGHGPPTSVGRERRSNPFVRGE